MLEIVREPDCEAVSITASGSFSQEDHTQLAAFLETALSEDGHLSILFDLDAVGREEVAATFPDVVKALPHRQEVGRVAIVGDEFLERMHASLAEDFPAAEIQFSRSLHLAEAWAWVRGRV